MSTKILEPVLRTRSQQRATRTRKRLLEAALAVFIERGVDAATVDEITQRADLGKGTLYRHFHDKYEIVITLIEQAVSHLAEYLHSYDSEPKNIEGVLDRIEKAIRLAIKMADPVRRRRGEAKLKKLEGIRNGKVNAKLIVMDLFGHSVIANRRAKKRRLTKNELAKLKAEL